ncbi:MAG: hypothetical protein RH980_18725 [Roseovarius confluentis]|jgi:hypothetical protein
MTMRIPQEHLLEAAAVSAKTGQEVEVTIRRGKTVFTIKPRVQAPSAAPVNPADLVDMSE